MGVIPEMKLEVYALKRQEKGFASLAGVVKDTFLKHDAPQVGWGSGLDWIGGWWVGGEPEMAGRKVEAGVVAGLQAAHAP